MSEVGEVGEGRFGKAVKATVSSLDLMLLRTKAVEVFQSWSDHTGERLGGGCSDRTESG